MLGALSPNRARTKSFPSRPTSDRQALALNARNRTPQPGARGVTGRFLADFATSFPAPVRRWGSVERFGGWSPAPPPAASTIPSHTSTSQSHPGKFPEHSGKAPGHPGNFLGRSRGSLGHSGDFPEPSTKSLGHSRRFQTPLARTQKHTTPGIAAGARRRRIAIPQSSEALRVGRKLRSHIDL